MKEETNYINITKHQYGSKNTEIAKYLTNYHSYIIATI